MKVLKKQHRLLFFISLPLLIASFLLIRFYLPIIPECYRIQWILLVAAIVIVFSPLGHRRLSSPTHLEPPRYTPLKWFTIIALFEIASWVVFIGINQLDPLSSLAAMQQITWKLGLFPWAAVALMSCALGYKCYEKNKATFGSTLFHQSSEGRLGMIINTSLRGATLFAFGSTLALAAVSIVNPYVVNAAFGGFHILSLVIYSILIFAVSSQRLKKPIHFLTIQKQWHPFVSLCLIFFLLTALLILLTIFFNHPGMTLKTPYLVTALMHYDLTTHWTLFTILWWVAWIPIFSVFIAYCSRGYSWRAMIMAVLALPLLINLIFLWHPVEHFFLMIHTARWFSLLSTVFGVVVLAILLGQQHTVPLLTQTALPKPDVIKYRSPERFIRTVLQFSVLMLCIYLASGISLFNVMFLALLIVPSVILVLLPLMLINSQF